MSGDRRAVGGEHGPSAVELLPRLKRDGCNLLVAGCVSEVTANRATQRLFGSPDLERKRVLVRTDEDARTADLLPSGVTAADAGVSVVEYSAHRDDADPLASLGREVSETVSAFDSHRTSLVGGELRLGVTSLAPLVSDHDVIAVEQFLSCATGAVSDARGMGHYRYLGPRSELSSLPVERLFDGFVDLREDLHEEQQLSIPTARPTGWLDL